MTEVQDLFETPELIPLKVMNVFDTFDQDADEYQELNRLLDKIEPLGYTFDYYLDAIPFNLRKMEDNLELSV